MEIKDELEKNPFLKAIFDSLPSIVFIVDRERRIQVVNDTVKNLLGKESKDLIGVRAGEGLNCVHSRDVDAGCGFGPMCENCIAKNTVMDAFKQNKSIYHREGTVTLYINNMPTRMDILINCVPFQFESNSFAVVTISDITELNALEHKRILDLERLSIIGASASSIVHDIKNPLAGIQGNTSLLKKSLKNPIQRNYCKKIKKGVSRITNMIIEITEHASGKESIDLEIKDINVDRFLCDIVSELQINNVISLNLVYRGSIAIDENKFRQVLWNIIKNADEAIENIDTGRIEISCNTSNGFIVICISDNGMGIPIEVRDKLFLPSQSFGKKSGSGFGLFSSKRIIEAHKGKLWFETALGKGTKFFIKLPRNSV